VHPGHRTPSEQRLSHVVLEPTARDGCDERLHDEEEHEADPDVWQLAPATSSGARDGEAPAYIAVHHSTSQCITVHRNASQYITMDHSVQRSSACTEH
jgi:hypothetical protein